MISAAVLILLAQQAPIPRARELGANRVRARESESLAFFEFAPASGRGMPAACGPPNWILQSEDLDNASWTKDFAGAGGSMTANFAIAPNGTMTAERLQCNSTAANCRVYQGYISSMPGDDVNAMWFKGNGTSGTIYLSHLGSAAQTASCSYNATTWTQCAHLNVQATGTTHWFMFGCEAGLYGMPATCPAFDVLVWGAQQNAGSTLGPYAKTTTSYDNGPALKGAKNEALTFTRASSATCTRTASGGLATTGIANGDLVSLASNQSRVTYDSAGVLGLLVESSRQNFALRSEELDNGAWGVCSGGGATVTANATTSPDGATTAERVQLIVGSFNAHCQTVTTAGAGVRTITAFVKDLASSHGSTIRAVGTGDAAGDVTCEALSISTTSWTRVQCITGNYGAGLTAISIRFFNSTIDSNRNFDGYIFGVSMEAGAYATSYIPTTTAAVTRSAEAASFAVSGGPVDTAWSSASTTTSLPTTAYPSGASPMGLVAGGVGKLADYIFSNTFQAAGVCSPRSVMAISVGGPRRIANWIGAGQCAAIVDGTSQSGTAGGTSAVIDTVRVGYSTAAGPIDSIVSRGCLDPDPTRCR